MSRELLRPDDLFKLRPQVARYAVAMERKLRLNDHKGGWQGMPIEQLFNLAVHELDELLRAIKRGAGPEAIAQEAADVGNYLMMIADNATSPKTINPENPP